VTTGNANKKTVLSAVQTNNKLQIGNYLGAIQNWVPMQDTHDCIFFAVDLHAITTKQDPKALKHTTYQAIATYLACGLDPKKSILFAQSAVPAHTELGWVLTCFSNMGELSRMTQFKDKTSKQEHVPTGLFVYPVLMAADILLYRTHFVPVGADQKQHIELTRDLAERMNNHFGDPTLFQIPEPMIAKSGAKIMDLQDPTKKMSKSDETGNGVVYIVDDAKTIEKKFKRAVTDSGSEVQAEQQSAGVTNMIEIQAKLRGVSNESVLKEYVGKGYGYLKVDTANVVIQHLEPIQAQINHYMNDLGELDRILADGAQKARNRAAQQITKVYDKLGFLPRNFG
jgi:tryptophanyl-tRNA synthetase